MCLNLYSQIILVEWTAIWFARKFKTTCFFRKEGWLLQVQFCRTVWFYRDMHKIVTPIKNIKTKRHEVFMFFWIKNLKCPYLLWHHNNALAMWHCGWSCTLCPECLGLDSSLHTLKIGKEKFTVLTSENLQFQLGLIYWVSTLKLLVIGLFI